MHIYILLYQNFCKIIKLLFKLNTNFSKIILNDHNKIVAKLY